MSLARRVAVLGAAAVLLAGCAPKIVRHSINADEVVDAGAPRLACPWRLAPVAEGRPDSDRVGGLNSNAFRIDDAPALVGSVLAPMGWAAADTSAPEVRVTLKRLYMSQNVVTKIPVVVYGVDVPGQPAFLVRAQPANANWAGSESEARSGYRRAFMAANADLATRLNRLCAARTG